jgi:NADH:ubiquinone oxidoreductase subunit F (NADH-binding)
MSAVADPATRLAGVPRLLAGVVAGAPGAATAGAAVAGVAGPVDLARHRLVHPAPPPPRPDGRPWEDFVAAVERSGLRGRGGAGFPTGRKLRAVGAGRRGAVVVVNGAEGEPASAKDKLLLSLLPHLVLDGALLAAAAVGADEVLVCVDQRAGAARAAVARAVEQRRRAEPGLPLRLVAVPSRYVAGEETALVHLLDGGVALPTRTPPRVFERGVGGRPALVDNVETLAHLAQVLRFGPEWFRRLGTAEEPGSALVTLSGAVARPGVYEVPIGARLADVVGAAGGALAGGAAVLVGGYFGAWLDAATAGQARLSAASLRPLGASLGCGAVVVLPEGACGLAETARVLRWLAGQSAGQCGPCVHGLAAVAAATAELHAGRGGAAGLERLRRWAGQAEGRGACRMPDGAVRFLRSALEVFAGDLARHLRHGGCPAAGPPVLPIPAADRGTIQPPEERHGADPPQAAARRPDRLRRPRSVRAALSRTSHP